MQSFPRLLFRRLVGLVGALGVLTEAYALTRLWAVIGARRRLQQLSRTRLGAFGKMNGGGKAIGNVDLPYQS